MNKRKIARWLLIAASVALVVLGLGIVDGDLNNAALTAAANGQENYLSLFAKMELIGSCLAISGGLLLYLLLKKSN